MQQAAPPPPPTASASTTPLPVLPEARAPDGTLRLHGGPIEDRRVRWGEEVIDNEGLGRKKSKVCCIYHRPRAYDESSSEESSDDSSDSEAEGKGCGDGCGGGGKAREKRPRKNAYEKQPKGKGKGGEEVKKA